MLAGQRSSPRGGPPPTTRRLRFGRSATASRRPPSHGRGRRAPCSGNGCAGTSCPRRPSTGTPEPALPTPAASPRTRATAAREGYHRAAPGGAMAKRLPPPLDAIVGQIETEIGEPFGAGADGPALAETPEGVVVSRNGRVEQAVREILREIGEDPGRAGLLQTPGRVHGMYRELLAGYRVDPDPLLNGAIFEVEYSEVVVVKDIEFCSLCEHRLLPFFGKAAVAYIPRDKVVGLSKLPRIVEMFARRLQVQERMTQQIADFIQERLDPKGVGVVVEAPHLCMVMRGVRKEALVTTAALHGLMQARDPTRAEFLAHLGRGA